MLGRLPGTNPALLAALEDRMYHWSVENGGGFLRSPENHNGMTVTGPSRSLANGSHSRRYRADRGTLGDRMFFAGRRGDRGWAT